MSAPEITIDLDGGDLPDLGLEVRLTFGIQSAEWIESHWHGHARLESAEIVWDFGGGTTKLPVDQVAKSIGPSWLARLELRAFDEWSEHEPSPKQARLQRRGE